MESESTTGKSLTQQDKDTKNLISYFRSPIQNTIPHTDIPLAKVHQHLIADTLKQVTEGCRNGTKKKGNDLPYITPSGTFTKRSDNNLVTYSGYICIDLDHLEDHFISQLRDKIAGDGFLKPVLIFISPSNIGLKVFIKINGGTAQNHLLHLDAITKYLDDKYLIKADQTCKDIPRACFLCHDPEAYFNDAGGIDSEELLKYDVTNKNVSPQQHNAIIPQIHQHPSDELNRLEMVHNRAIVALKSNGWQQRGENWIRPGKDPKSGTSAKFNVDPNDGLNKFTCFSDNGSPFENKGYTDVGVICLLEYRNDWARCIKELAHEYLSPNIKPKTTIKTTTEEYFKKRTFRQVVEDGSKESERRKIIGAFLYENTNHYLFSRTNYGKSLLAFQFAYAMATGSSFDACLALKNDCEPMKVLVVDLELEERDLFERHGDVINNTNPELLKNLIYIHEKETVKPVFNFELLEKIEAMAISEKVSFVIIDNISKLLPDLLKAEDVSRIIEALKRIRQKLKAGFLIIGHTTKGDPRTAISPVSYYGSAMLQNFFTEICYLDKTKDGEFFLCHTKTKRAECYSSTVPVFTRGEHEKIGYGFTFLRLQSLSDIQLPLNIQTHGQRKNSLSKYKNELMILETNGTKRTIIAEMCNVDRSTITRLLDG